MPSPGESSDRGERYLSSEPISRRHIPATRHASAYQSLVTLPETGMLTESDLSLLGHVNCSLLSSGRRPTLLELKQHAQSLCNLIRKLCTSESLGHWAARNADDFTFDENDAFDFLNDLDTLYANDDESHHVPLAALRNTLGENLTVHKKIECPWTKVMTEDGAEMPYLHHESLLEHADECLVRLDDEFAETGGILSILPREDSSTNESDLANVRNSFIGQWLLHYQHLVARTHELEINYLNTLDLLAGEANVALQLSSDVQQRTGTTRVSTQDRFILANAGEEVGSVLHDFLDREEAQRLRKDHQWKKSGVIGDRLQKTAPTGEVFSAGLVSVDVKSRFYRHIGAGRGSPIFIVPAHGTHPGAEHTRQAEGRPATLVLPSRVTVPFPDLPNEEQLRQSKDMEVDGEKAAVQN